MTDLEPRQCAADGCQTCLVFNNPRRHPPILCYFHWSIVPRSIKRAHKDAWWLLKKTAAQPGTPRHNVLSRSYLIARAVAVDFVDAQREDT